MRSTLLILFLFAGTLFAQKDKLIKISGKVYMTSSRSQGIANGKTFTDPQHPHRNQNIYFNNDTITVWAKTDTAGNYTVELKPGNYNVYQEEALKNKHPGSMSYHSGWVVVKKDGGPYDVYLSCTVNGRMAMTPKGMPGEKNNGSKTTKKEEKTIGPTPTSTVK